MTGCCCFSLLWTKENMYNHCQAVCCNSPCRHRGLPVKNEQPEQDNSSHSFHSSSLFFFWFSCLLGKENSFQERPRLSGHRRSVNQCVYMVCVCVCVCLQTFLFPMPEVQRDKTPPLLSFPGLRIIWHCWREKKSPSPLVGACLSLTHSPLVYTFYCTCDWPTFLFQQQNTWCGSWIVKFKNLSWTITVEMQHSSDLFNFNKSLNTF